MRGDPIVGGTDAPADSAVFILTIASNTGITSLCSATLIAPRTLITAAHCVDPSMIGGTSLSLEASNAPTRAQATSWNRVLETRLHPSWNPGAGLDFDLAVLLLATPVTTAPAPWNDAPLDALGGAPVRAVGYGADTPDGGQGTRRTVDLTIRQLTPELITLGDLLGRGICHGDSGGPTLHTFPDGLERVIGLHSYTRGDLCVDGADTRLDANAAFLRQWLSDREDTCGDDRVCSPTPCPLPDADCRALGAPCTLALDCPARQCVTDAQHPASYCSRPCAADLDCEGGLTCDLARGLCVQAQVPVVGEGASCGERIAFCETGMTCALDRCRRPCALSSQCPDGSRCEGPDGGPSFCASRAQSWPVARIQGPVAGCAQAPELLTLLAVALFRPRRVRAATAGGNC